MEPINKPPSYMTTANEDDTPLHGKAHMCNDVDLDSLEVVFDLPQLHTKPSATALLSTLDLLTINTPSWDRPPKPLSGTIHPSSGTGFSSSVTPHSTVSAASIGFHPTRRPVDPNGVPRYLTSIISSPLHWLPDASDRDAIWTLASQRLSERCGRTAVGPLTRSFRIPLDLAPATSPGADIEITLHEPAITGDSPGLKTWGSAYLLAQRLRSLTPFLPRRLREPTSSTQQQRYSVLELGAGTGLVGIAAAAVWGAGVVLTDVVSVVEGNLAHNVEANRQSVEAAAAGKGAAMTTAVLDWWEPEKADLPVKQFPLVVAADCVYDSAHPVLLARTAETWLERNGDAVFLVESPIRDGFAEELEMLREEMETLRLEIKDEGREYGLDDWGMNRDDELKEIECWWAIWGWKDEILGVGELNM